MGIPIECYLFVCVKYQWRRASHILFQHARSCGGGVGIYLLVLSSYIVIVRGPRAAVWGSVYLDEHGEEDRDLKWVEY